MITTDKYQTIARRQDRNEWYFLPFLLNAVAGVGVGMIIGNYFGLL